MFDLISIIIAYFQRIEAFSPNGAGLQTIISAIAYVSFLIFLKQVAEFIHKNNLAKDAEGVLLIGHRTGCIVGISYDFPHHSFIVFTSFSDMGDSLLQAINELKRSDAKPLDFSF
jgi:hypothetical protein